MAFANSVEIFPVEINRAGVDLTTPLTAATDTHGNRFHNDGKTLLRVKNGSASPITVTIDTPGTVVGLPIADLEVAVPAPADGLVLDGGLAIDATAEKFKTTQTAVFLIAGVVHTKAAAAELVFTAAHVITANKFGAILIQIDDTGTISTKVVASPQAYDDAPAALAALPAPDAGNVKLGHIAIENNAGDWTANTDDLTDASDVASAAFVDATAAAIDSLTGDVLIGPFPGEFNQPGTDFVWAVFSAVTDITIAAYRVANP